MAVGSDTFTGSDGSAPDSDLWAVNASYSGLPTADGTCQIMSNALRQSASPTVGNMAAIGTLYKFIGNFQIDVALDFSGFTSTNHRAYIYYYTDSNNWGFFGVRYASYIANSYVGGSWTTSDTIQSAHATTTTMRLYRTGTTMTLRFYDRGFWETFTTNTCQGNAVKIILSHRNLADSSTICTWDTYTINIGTTSNDLSVSSGIGFASSILGKPGSISVYAGLGLSSMADAAFDIVKSIDAYIGFDAYVLATNITQWVRQNAARAIYRYYAVITGGADGQDDYEFVDLKSIQSRMRDGDPSYLALSLVLTSDNAQAISDRPNGEIVVYMDATVDGISSLREELIRADFYSVASYEGAKSKSIDVVAYKTRSYAAGGTANLEGVTIRTVLADGRIQYRCAKPDFYIRPGFIVSYDGDTIEVGSVSYLVSSATGMTYMEISE